MTTSLSCTLHPSTLLISTNGSDTCLDCMIYEFSDKESTLLHSSRVLLTRYFIEALNHKRVQDYLQVHRDLIIHLLSGIVRAAENAGTNESFLEELSQLVQFAIGITDDCCVHFFRLAAQSIRKNGLQQCYNVLTLIGASIVDQSVADKFLQTQLPLLQLFARHGLNYPQEDIKASIAYILFMLCQTHEGRTTLCRTFSGAADQDREFIDKVLAELPRCQQATTQQNLLCIAVTLLRETQHGALMQLIELAKLPEFQEEMVRTDVIEFIGEVMNKALLMDQCNSSVIWYSCQLLLRLCSVPASASRFPFILDSVLHIVETAISQQNTELLTISSTLLQQIPLESVLSSSSMKARYIHVIRQLFRYAIESDSSELVFIACTGLMREVVDDIETMWQTWDALKNHLYIVLSDSSNPNEFEHQAPLLSSVALYASYLLKQQQLLSVNAEIVPNCCELLLRMKHHLEDILLCADGLTDGRAHALLTNTVKLANALISLENQECFALELVVTGWLHLILQIRQILYHKEQHRAALDEFLANILIILNPHHSKDKEDFYNKLPTQIKSLPCVWSDALVVGQLVWWHKDQFPFHLIELCCLLLRCEKLDNIISSKVAEWLVDFLANEKSAKMLSSIDAQDLYNIVFLCLAGVDKTLFRSLVTGRQFSFIRLLESATTSCSTNNEAADVLIEWSLSDNKIRELAIYQIRYHMTDESSEECERARLMDWFRKCHSIRAFIMAYLVEEQKSRAWHINSMAMLELFHSSLRSHPELACQLLETNLIDICRSVSVHLSARLSTEDSRVIQLSTRFVSFLVDLAVCVDSAHLSILASVAPLIYGWINNFNNSASEDICLDLFNLTSVLLCAGVKPECGFLYGDFVRLLRTFLNHSAVELSLASCQSLLFLIVQNSSLIDDLLIHHLCKTCTSLLRHSTDSFRCSILNLVAKLPEDTVSRMVNDEFILATIACALSPSIEVRNSAFGVLHTLMRIKDNLPYQRFWINQLELTSDNTLSSKLSYYLCDRLVLFCKES